MTDLLEVTRRAQEHADNLQRDINNASTRIEHIRLTQLALEAHRLVELLQSLATATVETEISLLEDEDRKDYTENV